MGQVSARWQPINFTALYPEYYLLILFPLLQLHQGMRGCINNFHPRQENRTNLSTTRVGLSRHRNLFRLF